MIKGVVVGQPRKTRVLSFECPKCRKEHSVFVRKVCDWPDNPYRSMPGINHIHWHYQQEDQFAIVRPGIHFASGCGFQTDFEWRVWLDGLESPPNPGPT